MLLWLVVSVSVVAIEVPVELVRLWTIVVVVDG